MSEIAVQGNSTVIKDRVADCYYANMSDQEIVEIAQAGMQSAAEYLLYKYRSLVRTKVRSYFLLGAEKEDLLQIGMIGLWQAILDYRADKDISFLSFARICIERHVITAIKTATRQKQAPLNTSVSLEYPSDDSESEWNLAEILVSEDTIDPEELVLKREDNRRLQDMLRRLLSDFEWRVLAGYQLGKSYREIATELQCKTKSVDNALARIKRKISGTPYCWPGISDPN
ncbi:MAG TPA: RNA polymerase sporulation sigma factor SigH [Armatimonadota bacterium]|jgi:RNA polymerase sporulation-specific sigma factor|nr:RNA polymerase sporulation sigma factor SigH [Armatimonadota bacterium]HOM70781.1 RNA polymerase sporulation sigma factor SigH [Armatimonadota bacterium]HPP75265.1 RNA polymerase sporulation sigma factor SigH [Armatimonadota bacterium]